jgi:phosphotransferase system IIA component
MKSKMEIRDTQVKVTKANLDGFEMDDEEDGAAESGEELSDDDIEKFNKKSKQKYTYMVSNPNQTNPKNQSSKKDRKTERYTAYKDSKALSSKFVKELEDQMEERPVEFVSVA